ncbi:MAG: histidine kinase dimerization/phosphoacceptor domain -containing protein, partial [Parvibaculum sp.]
LIHYLLLLFPLLIWVTASLFAGWATDHMVIEPLNKVRQAIRRYIAGDDTARIERDPGAPVEVQAVATKFNALAETIHARNDALRASLDYQKALVREINHRVRNNLQVMNSLLSLQSRRARTPEQATIFLDVQRRLNALGIVHTAFYQGDDFRSIDLCTLLRDLCESSEQQFSNEWGSPIITMQCPTQIYALPDAALTLAFLVTELIAEVAAQASPNDYSGTRFDFELLPHPDGGSVLTMMVDRPVLAGLMESSPDESHIKLFRGLIRQLRAKMEVNEEEGIVTVTLPPLI